MRTHGYRTNQRLKKIKKEDDKNNKEELKKRK